MAQPIVDNQPVQDAITGYLDGTDTYAQAVALIAHTLEVALGDGVNDSMSQGEFDILEALARLLVEQDPAVQIDPQGAAARSLRFFSASRNLGL